MHKNACILHTMHIYIYTQGYHSNGRMKLPDFSLTFTLLFQEYLKKKIQPSNMYAYWQQSMQNEITNTIEINSKAIC